MRRTLVLLASLALVGCTTMYVNPHATALQEKRDMVECRALSEQGIAQGGLFRGVLVEQQYRECLISRGYRPQS